MTIEITYPAWFAPALTTEARYIDLLGGRGRGGSHTGTNYFLDLITRPHYFRGYFVRQSFNDIRASLFQDFKDRIAENDTVDISQFRIQENEMRITYIPTGNMIISKGVKKEGSRTAKMKSLAGATHVLVEEADELGKEDFMQMDDSLRTKKAQTCQIIRIFNPPFKDHWIWERDYSLVRMDSPEGYFKAVPKHERPVCSLFATHRSNIRNLPNDFVRNLMAYRESDIEYFYTVVCGLISEGRRGIIFKNWQPCTNEVFNSIEARSIIGIDFGENTGGIVEIKTVRNTAYMRELYYGGGSAKDIGIKMASLGITTETIIADCAEPAKIAKLRQGWTRSELLPDEIERYPQLLKGFTIYPVRKPAGSIVTGIGIMRGYEVFYTEDSKNLATEYQNYAWALDKNKQPTDMPIDGYNHCFVAGTLATTDKGDIPIEQIQVGDMVLTRAGYKKVLWSGCSGIRDVWRYNFSGDEVCCTPEHKFYTNNGWKEAQDVLCSDKLTYIGGEYSSTWIEKQYIGMRPVYDITVDEQHEFFANGILVHNCIDPARYVLFSRGTLW